MNNSKTQHEHAEPGSLFLNLSKTKKYTCFCFISDQDMSLQHPKILVELGINNPITHISDHNLKIPEIFETTKIGAGMDIQPLKITYLTNLT